MKGASNKSESRKRKRDESQELITETTKKAKVHAQRKFAQGASYSSSVITPIKDKVRPPANAVATSGPIIRGKCPNTEDFLTFLCFRRTSILPPKLNFFKEGFISEPEPAPQEKTEPVKQKTSPEQKKKQTKKTNDKKDEKKKTPAPAVQALRKKYQEQRLAKQKPSNVTTMAKKVKGKNLIRTRSGGAVEEPKTTVKKPTQKQTKPGCLRSGLKRSAPIVKKPATKIVKGKLLRAGLRSGGAASKNPAKSTPEPKPSPIASKKIEKEVKIEVQEQKVKLTRGRKAEGFSDFSSDDNEPLLAVKKIKKELGQVKAVGKTRSKKVENFSSKVLLRPSRKTKEAAALYVEMITKKLVSPNKSGDDDDMSVDSFPELPNVKRTEQRETEIKAKALAPKKTEPKQPVELKDKETKKPVGKKKSLVEKKETKTLKSPAPKKESPRREPKSSSKQDDIKEQSVVSKRTVRQSAKEELPKVKELVEESKEVTRRSTRNTPKESFVLAKKDPVKLLSKKILKKSKLKMAGKSTNLKSPIKVSPKTKPSKNDNLNSNTKSDAKGESQMSPKQSPKKEQESSSKPPSSVEDVKQDQSNINRKTNDKKVKTEDKKVKTEDIKVKAEDKKVKTEDKKVKTDDKKSEDITQAEGKVESPKKRGRKPNVVSEKNSVNDKVKTTKKKTEKKAPKEEEIKIEVGISKRPTRKCSTVDKIWIDIDGFTSDEDDFLDLNLITKSPTTTKKETQSNEESNVKVEKEKTKTSVDKTKNEKPKEAEAKVSEKKSEAKKSDTDKKCAEKVSSKSPQQVVTKKLDGKVKKSKDEKTAKPDEEKSKKIEERKTVGNEDRKNLSGEEKKFTETDDKKIVKKSENQKSAVEEEKKITKVEPKKSLGTEEPKNSKAVESKIKKDEDVKATKEENKKGKDEDRKQVKTEDKKLIKFEVPLTKIEGEKIKKGEEEKTKKVDTVKQRQIDEEKIKKVNDAKVKRPDMEKVKKVNEEKIKKDNETKGGTGAEIKVTKIEEKNVQTLLRETVSRVEKRIKEKDAVLVKSKEKPVEDKNEVKVKESVQEKAKESERKNKKAEKKDLKEKNQKKANRKTPKKPRNSSKKEGMGDESQKRTRPVRQCSTGEKRWIETDSDFSFYESEDEDLFPFVDFGEVKSSPITKDIKVPEEKKTESVPEESKKEEENFSESDEEPLKKKPHVEGSSKKAEAEVKGPVKIQREVPALAPIPKSSEVYLPVNIPTPLGKLPTRPEPAHVPIVIPPEPKPLYYEPKNLPQPLSVPQSVEFPKFLPEPRQVSVPNRIEMILHSLKRDKINETSSHSNDVKVTFGNVSYQPMPHSSQMNQIPCTYQVKATFPTPREPISTHGLDLLSEVALPTTPKENTSQTKRIEKWLNDSVTSEPKSRFSSYDNNEYKTADRVHQTVSRPPQPQQILPQPQPQSHPHNQPQPHPQSRPLPQSQPQVFPSQSQVIPHSQSQILPQTVPHVIPQAQSQPLPQAQSQPTVNYYYGKPVPTPPKVNVSSHTEIQKFGQTELLESQKLLKKNVFASEVKQDNVKPDHQPQPSTAKKPVTSVQDLLKLQKERKEVTKTVENAPHLKNCKCNNCIVKKGWFKNKPVPKAEQQRPSPVEEKEESPKPFESLTKAFIGEGKNSKMSVSVAPMVVSQPSTSSISKTEGEKKGIFQQRKLSFLERMKERERKEAAAAAKLASNAFSPNNESSVYAFEPEPEQTAVTNAPFRNKTRDSRNSSTSKSDDEGLKICEEEIPTVSSGTQVEKSVTDKLSKSFQSASIAVQVNLDTETVTEVETVPEPADGKSIEISTQTEVPEEDSDSPMFYIPLQQATAAGSSTSSDQQLIQGVALKLGTEGPMGPNQRVIMKAKLVTKPPDSPSIKAVVMPQPKRIFDQKFSNPPIGTVQPTTRKPPDERTADKSESAKIVTASAKETSEPSSQSSEVLKTTRSTASGKSTKSKENTQTISKDKAEEKNSPSSSSSSTKPKRAAKQKSTDSVIGPTNSTWLPPGSASSKLVEAPTFHPTEKDFQEPFEFFERIRPAAEKFGLCRIVPPCSFKPDCKVSDDMRFTAYNQYIHRMFHRWGPNIKEMMAIKKYLATQSISLKQPPWIGGIEVDLPRLYQSVQNCGGLMKVMEKKKWNQVADMMRIPKAAQDRVTKLDDIYCKYLLPYDTLSHDERQKLFDEVEKDWNERLKTPVESQDTQEDEESEENYIEECEECVVKGKNMALNQFFRIARNTMSMWFKNPEPSSKEVENEFWKHVSERNHHVCVHSGSIDSSGWGYGFPIAKNNSFSKHPWNLKVLTNNSGSVLRYLGPVMGVTVPTIHVGMLFTAFCWYRDPHGLPWIEYLHTGAPKIWYGISDDNSVVFQEALKKLLPRYIKNKTIWLPSDTAMIPPELLVEHGVSLCRTVQEPGQFILVFPRAFTSSICTGYLVSESVYFAQSSWLTTAEQVFKDIQESCEPSMFSLEKLLFSIATDSRSSADVLKQVLPMVWHVRQKEVDGRKTLFNLGLKSSERLPAKEPGNKKKKGRWVQEDDGDYECEICRTNLYVSLVTNSQEEGVYCLPHAIDLLTQKRHQLKFCKLMYTYTQEEMNEMVEKLEARIESKSQKKPSQSKPSTSSK